MSLTNFKFNSMNVRTITDEQGNPWFVAADVCAVLEIRNNRDAMSRLDDDEKADVGITDTSSNGVTQERNMTIINESGLYSLILTSRKPEAKSFKKWVTSEVLPSIRKKGSYSVDERKQTTPFSIEDIARSLMFINESMRVSESGKLKSLRTLYEHYNIPSNSLPDYTVDSPTVTAGSSEPTLPITAILERTGSKLTPVSANKKLNEVGLLKRQSRKSSNGELKYYWSITDDGLKYGKNLTSDKNQRETQPHWYVRTMYELIGEIE